MRFYNCLMLHFFIYEKVKHLFRCLLVVFSFFNYIFLTVMLNPDQLSSEIRCLGAMLLFLCCCIGKEH